MAQRPLSFIVPCHNSSCSRNKTNVAKTTELLSLTSSPSLLPQKRQNQGWGGVEATVTRFKNPIQLLQPWFSQEPSPTGRNSSKRAPNPKTLKTCQIEKANKVKEFMNRNPWNKLKAKVGLDRNVPILPLSILRDDEDDAVCGRRECANPSGDERAHASLPNCKPSWCCTPLQLHALAQPTLKAVPYCTCCWSIRKAGTKTINHICSPLIWSGHECSF